MTAKLDNAVALYMEGIRDGNARYAVETYTGDRYTQHSTGVRDGVEGFVEFFEPFLERNPVRDIQVVRGFEDGRNVFLQVYQNINDGEAEWVTTDFFDTDEHDKIIEHWDIIAPYSGVTPSGHTSLDGPTEIVDIVRTEDNKAIVRKMIEEVLIAGGDPTRVGEFIAQECTQHNTEVADGLDPFRELVTAPGRALRYSQIVLLVGQGNFVATLCKATFDGVPYAQCDIFRLEEGLIVEHWDNAEAIGPEAEWVNSGKF
jgi:predicted SnoaL-like aldol condensation-catalyzing enzyme